MNESDILTRLQKKLREVMNDTADHISADGCKTLEEYKKCCGIIEGLALAERELLDMVEADEEN
jgi:hypothetical protein|tara:strand:+ start:995 stop:1186 length:192 start_codon:yes stop_codon:yes gene_type:complete